MTNGTARKIFSILAVLTMVLSLTACVDWPVTPINSAIQAEASSRAGSVTESAPSGAYPEPEGSDTSWTEVNGNEPYFTAADLTTDPFEMYSEFDEYGRCGVAYANICQELMPTEERGEIGQVKPTGWHTVKYDSVDGKYLYNRCHLIGFQLAGENANEKNLITGTRYFNVEGMLPFENMVADFVKETGNHVLYRVTPDFRDSELVAHGVYMEAYSVEDDGDGICFNVYVYNIQPGITIDYATGESAESAPQNPSANSKEEASYILNVRSGKFHYSDCEAISKISEKNYKEISGNRSELVSQGYAPCGICKP